MRFTTVVMIAVSSVLLFAQTGGGVFPPGGGAASFTSLIPTSPDSSITIGNTGTAAPTFALNTASLAGVYPTIAGPNTFTAGGTNTFQASGGGSPTAGIRIVSATNPAVLAGALNTDLAGVLFNSDGTLWRGMISNTAGQDLRALSTGFAKITTTTGAFSTVTPAFTDLSGSAACAQLPALTGDITTSAGACATTIGAAKVAPSMMKASTFDTQTDGATVTWAIASVLNAQGTVTLAGNRTLAITNPVVGGNYLLKVVQDGTGSRTLALGSGCTWKVSGGSGAGAITPTTTAAAIDMLAFTYDGTNCYATFNKNFN